MNQKQAGFTLIELIAVIVILGILAATAVPRFVDMQDAAGQAAVDGMAGGLSSASALNYAAEVAQDANVSGATAPIDQANCTDASALLQPPTLPTGYSITAGVLSDSGTQCQITLTRGSDTYNATFVGYQADST